MGGFGQFVVMDDREESPIQLLSVYQKLENSLEIRVQKTSVSTKWSHPVLLYFKQNVIFVSDA